MNLNGYFMSHSNISASPNDFSVQRVTNELRDALLNNNCIFILIGMLSRLLGDPIYESYARRAIDALWKHRNTTTDLFSNDINIETGRWVSKVCSK